MTLEVNEFPQFFEALWGYEPFPWQDRLLRYVVDEGQYPDVLALGTGVGKTSVMDIHVFAQALEAQKAATDRRLPRRLFFVVDRRVIVDQTAMRAGDIARKLARASHGILKRVADELRRLSGEQSPLRTAVLRGGMVRDDKWARTPDQPMIVSSTVDQVGSRLLFRGYGVSQGMAPIHAGLVGADALIVLDEVHLAEPFRQTLEAITRSYRYGHPGLPDRWQVLTMSATPGQAPGSVFRLDQADRGHEVLTRRLHASRPAKLAKIKAKGSKTAADKKLIVGEAVAQTMALLDSGHKAIGVVLNRVELARLVWDRLSSRKDLAKKQVAVALVTGRMRPLDREAIDPQLAALQASRKQEPANPIVLVSTQSIEAGADLDFDGMVTQAASIDALQQRMGRLNRMGRYDAEEPSQQAELFEIATTTSVKNAAQAVILCPPPVADKDADPIYGKSIDATVKFLQTLAPRGENPDEVSFRLDELQPALDEFPDRQDLSVEPDHAPILLPTYMKLWTRTRPRPFPDPEVAPYLHGPQVASDVQIVWRDDITERLLDEASSGDENASAVLESLVVRLEALPPATLEAMSVPVYAARAWLSRQNAVSIADVAVSVDQAKEAKKGDPTWLAVRWDGDDTQIVGPEQIRVGDTLVVPSLYGGLNAAGVWSPERAEPVPDVSQKAQWQGKGRAVLKPSAWPQTSPGWVRRVLLTDKTGEGDQDGPFESKAEERQAILQWLRSIRLLADGVVPGWLGEAAEHLVRVGWQRVIVGRGTEDDAADVILLGNRPRTVSNELDFEPEVSFSLPQPASQAPVTLREHSESVAKFAKGYARRLGLPDPLVRDIELAGRLHDLGKADPRFQLMLAGGDPVQAAMAGEPLAKSRVSSGDRAQREATRSNAGYPKGARHELLSLSLASAAKRQWEAVFDGELVEHLIASHHGWCRPLAPAVPDLEPVDVHYPSVLDESRSEGHAQESLFLQPPEEKEHDDVTVSSAHGLATIGSGVADRFATLNERYGPHMLAWLESIMRLADHRASELASRQGGTK